MAPLAFEEDVVRADFGVRQMLSFAGVAALFVGLVPQLVAATDGRWYLPDGDFDRALSVVDDGDDFSAPCGSVTPTCSRCRAGPWTRSPAVNLGMSEGLDPIMSQRYRLDGGTSIEAVTAALTAALEGRTARLGRGISPMAIQYVVVVDRPAPEPFAARRGAGARGVVDALEEQLDLRRVLVGPGIDMFEVREPWPPRSDITETPASPVRPRRRCSGQGFGTSFSGELDDDSTGGPGGDRGPGLDAVHPRWRRRAATAVRLGPEVRRRPGWRGRHCAGRRR